MGARSGAFSDVSSHGTYAQPPMSHHESYGMREIAPGDVYDPYGTGTGAAVSAGAAGIGVARARSTRDGGMHNPAAQFQEGGTPYAAFAGPGYAPDMYANGGAGRNTADLLEAAGMGNHLGGAGANLARNPTNGGNGYYNQASPYPSPPPNRSPSSHGHGNEFGYVGQPGQGSTGGTQYYPADSYSSHSHNGAAAGYAYSTNASPPPLPNQGQPQPQQYYGRHDALNEEDEDAAYGGYVAEDMGGSYNQYSNTNANMPPSLKPGAPVPAPVPYGAPPAPAAAPAPGPSADTERMPNPFDKKVRDDESLSRYSEDDDPQGQKRVLKVANE